MMNEERPRPIALHWYLGGRDWLTTIVCWLTDHQPIPYGPQLFVCRDCSARATWRFL